MFFFLCLQIAHAQVTDTLGMQLKQMPDDTNKVMFMLKLVEEQLHNQPEKAFQYIEQIENLSEALNFMRGQAAALKQKGDYFRLKSDFAAAMQNFQQAGVMYHRLGDFRSEQVCKNQISSCYFETGNYAEARRISEEVLNYAEQTGDKKMAASSFMRIANSWREEGNIRQSIEFTLKAARIFEEWNENKSLAQAYNNIAVDFKDLKDFKNALIYFERSLELKKESGDVKSIATTYSNMGNLYRNMEDYVKALRFLNTSLSMRKEIGDKKGISQDLQNIGLVYRHQKKYKEALKNYEESLRLKREIGDKKGEAIVCFNTAQLLVDREQFSEALTYLEKAERKAEEVNSKDLLADILSLRSKALESLNEQKASLDNLKRSVAINDSLMDAERLKQILELQTRYETERKDKEIMKQSYEIEKSKAMLERQALLKYLFAAIALALIIIFGFAFGYFRQKQKLEKQKAIEQTRAAIASDLHDDIGATLSSINIFSRIASKKLTEEPEESKSILEKISEASQNMMNTMSDLVWAIKPDNDDYENLSYKIKAAAQELFDKTGIAYSIEDQTRQGMKLNMKTRKNLFLIAKEAMNNTVKYSGANKVIVKMKTDEKNWLLEISDDGKGFDPDKSNAGNGIKNMKSRAKEIGGEIKIDSVPGSGTRIAVTCRLDKINY